MDTRKHEFIIEIAAAPDEIWQALTDATRIQQWFAPAAEVQPGEGGSIKLSWGEGCEGTAPIHRWEEGRRLGWTEGVKTVEIEIEPVGGGESTRLRLVQSGFGADAKFDQEYESTHGGWLTYLAMLKHSTEHFAGARATHMHTLRMVPAALAAHWARLVGPEGLAIDSVADGKPFRARLGSTRLEGTVLRHPKPGYLAVATAHSIIAFFVEGAGDGSMQTVQWILFDGGSTSDESPRQTLAEFTSSLAGPEEAQTQT